MSKITTTIYIERDEVELEVVVTGDYSAGCAGVMTLRNGDAGYPEEPEEINDITAETANCLKRCAPIAKSRKIKKVKIAIDILRESANLLNMKTNR